MQLINKRGFTLVELTVTLGIAGLLTLLSMRLSMTTYNQEALLKYKASVNEAVTMVQSSLKDPAKCTDALRGLEITTSGKEVPDGLKMNGGTVSLLKQGSYADFQVESIKLADSVLNATSFDLVITFKPRGMTAVNSFFSASNSDVTERITVVGLKNAGKIRSCGPILSDTKVLVRETFCKSLQGFAQWNNTTKKCTYSFTNIKCIPPLVPSYMKGNASFQCTHVAWKIEYDNLFDFGKKDCTTKNYSLFQNEKGLITIGCPDPATKAIGAAKQLEN